MAELDSRKWRQKILVSECHVYFEEYLQGKTSAHIISLPRDRLRAVYVLPE